MSIVISGVNNNDRITASDGTLDLLSVVGFASTLTAPAISATGNLTAASINVDNNIQLGTAGIVTATTFVGNVTGNINNSTLLLQTGGTERLRIDSNGTLRVQGGDGNAYLQLERYENNDKGGRVRFVKSRSDTVGLNTIVQDGDTLGTIDFYGSDGNSGTRGGASISAVVDGTPGSADMPSRLIFKTVPDNSTVFTERLRIDSSGRVMIGTTAASTLASTDDLTISTSGSTGITLFSAAGNAGNITFGDGTSGDDRQRGLLQYHHLDNSMRFFTDAVRRMTIDSSGRLLAGTTDIGYNQFADNLTLADSANCGITLRSGSSNQGNIYFSDGTGTGADTYRGMITYAHADNNMQFATNSVERLRINSAGAVMVGGTLQAGSNGGLNAEVTNSGSETTPLVLINQGTADGSGVIYLIEEKMMQVIKKIIIILEWLLMIQVMVVKMVV